MNTEALKSVMTQLEADIAVSGWDQPSSLFIIEEVDDDPYVIKVAEFFDHPCDVLDALPPITKSTVKGIVLATEGWMVKVDRELVERVNEILDRLGVEGEIRQMAFDRSMSELQGKPSMHPDKVEVRYIHAMLMDGSMLMLRRERGEETLFEDADLQGRLMESLKRIVHA